MTKIVSFKFRRIGLMRILMPTIIMMVVISLIMMPIKAGATSADGRWITSSSSDVTIENEEAEVEVQSDTNAVEELLAWLVANIANWIVAAFNSSSETGIDATATGIIMGTVTNDDGNSVFVFSLHDNNIYGIIGATLFVVFRTVMMMFVFIMTLWAIVKTLFTSGKGQGLTELKMVLYDAIFFLAFLYFSPYLVDYICVARDYFIELGYDTVSGFLSEGSDFSAIASLEETYRLNYEEGTKSLGNAVIYLLVACIPITFLISYIKVAIQQTILFGMLPIFCVAGMRDKKTLSNWLSVFTSNAFIPALDTVLVCFALMIKSLLDTMNSSWGGTLLSAIMIMVMLHSVVPARNQILGMIGGAIGMPVGGGSGGFSMLAALGSAAIGAAASTLRRGKGGGEKSDEEATGGGNSDIKGEADKGMGSPNELQEYKSERDTGASSNGEGIQTEDNQSYGGSGADNGYAASSADTASEGAVADNLDASGTSLDATGISGDISGSDSGSVTINESGDSSSISVNGGDGVSLDKDAMNDIGAINEQASRRADAIYGEGGVGDAENRALYMKEIDDRATNLAKIDSVNRANDDIDIANSRSRADIANSQAKMSANNREIEKKEEQLAKFNKGEGTELSKSDQVKQEQIKNDISRLKAENETHQQNIDKSRVDIAKRDVTKQENQRNLREYNAKERESAQKQAGRGFDGTAYSSAADFKAALTKQNNLAARADYTNFKSSEYRGILSDKEVKQFSAQAKRREALKNIGGGIARTTIGAAGAAVGATAMYVATAGLDEGQAARAIGSAASLGYAAGSGMGSAAYGGASKVAGKAKDAASSKLAARKNTKKGTPPEPDKGLSNGGASQPQQTKKSQPSKNTDSPQTNRNRGTSTNGGKKTPPNNAQTTSNNAYRRINNAKESSKRNGSSNSYHVSGEKYSGGNENLDAQRQFLEEQGSRRGERANRNAEKAAKFGNKEQV